MASSWVGLIAFVVAAAAMLHCTAAETYTVGDTTEWKVPSSVQFYANWASGKSFVVGDVLSFKFTTGAHDVAQVSKTGYDGCTNTSATFFSASAAEVPLNTTGEHYFICTFGNGGHCNSGQKLSINVESSNSGPTPTPSSGATPPPSPNSASSLGAGFSGLVAVLTAFFL